MNDSQTLYNLLTRAVCCTAGVDQAFGAAGVEEAAVAWVKADAGDGQPQVLMGQNLLSHLTRHRVQHLYTINEVLTELII